MKITGLSLWHVPLTSHTAYHMADGKSCDTVVIAIETAALLHLGATTDPRRLLNMCNLSGNVAPRLARDGPTRKTGRIVPPLGPGLGITPDRNLLDQPDMRLD